MCDLMHFVVSTPTKNTTAENVVELFMEEVLLNFGMCAVIVIDYDSTFKGTFQKMCDPLKIIYWWISRGNYKGNSVKKFHQFLNKTQNITGGDQGTHGGFIRNAKTSQYAWNNSPIYDTDISWRLTEIGREFIFPLDVDISSLQPMNTSDNSALLQYLWYFSKDSQFSMPYVLGVDILKTSIWFVKELIRLDEYHLVILYPLLWPFTSSVEGGGQLYVLISVV